MSRAWTLLHDRVHRILNQRSLIQSDRLLIAVSGGQDSICLAKLLLDLQPKWGWQLAIAHCNHRWRTDADANAEFVRQLADTWQLPYSVQTAETVTTSEAAARHWRYEALSTIAQQSGYPCIATGHTASDRAETVLYNLVRGSGADGLQALTWSRELIPGVQLVRPLLELTRRETAQFCQEQSLTVWDDSTNYDLRYARNRIRHELLPYLTHFNPQAETALAQTAELLQADVDYLEQEAATLLRRSRVSERALDRTILRQAPLALQRRAIRQFLRTVLPIAPNFDHIEKLLTLLTAPNRSQSDPFPGGAIAQVENTAIVLQPAAKSRPSHPSE